MKKMNTKEVASNAAKARWAKVSKKKRSEIMRKVALARAKKHEVNTPKT